MEVNHSWWRIKPKRPETTFCAIWYRYKTVNKQTVNSLLDQISDNVWTDFFYLSFFSYKRDKVKFGWNRFYVVSIVTKLSMQMWLVVLHCLRAHSHVKNEHWKKAALWPHIFLKRDNHSIIYKIRKILHYLTIYGNFWHR